MNCFAVFIHFRGFKRDYMAAGVTDRLWSVEDLVALWESYEQRRAERAGLRLGSFFSRRRYMIPKTKACRSAGVISLPKTFLKRSTICWGDIIPS